MVEVYFLPANKWILAAFVALACPLSAQTAFGEADGTTKPAASLKPETDGAPFLKTIELKPTADQIWLAPKDGTGVDWKGVATSSLLFLGAQHSFRLATEPGTREGFKGPYIRNVLDSIGNLHGWADGDEFYVNYLGHPMQGSVAGFIWAQHDRDFRTAEFGANSRYWKSRLRAAAFSWAYSIQFEIGPVSEASVGAVQRMYPQQGFVDHAVTSFVGTGWMIAEDAIDRYLVQWLERRYSNPWLLMAARAMNPTRSFANAMRLKVPWARDDRPGLFTHGLLQRYMIARRDGPKIGGPTPEPEREPKGFGVSAFEFNMSFRPQVFAGSGNTGPCLGGGGEGALRLADSWQFVVDVSGCKLSGLGRNTSGDSLTFLAGPRWTPSPSGRWSPYAHLLVGGQKVFQEHIDARKLEDLKRDPAWETADADEMYRLYAKTWEATGWSLAAGGGLDVRLSQVLALRLASMEYRRSWLPPVHGRDYNSGLSFTTGVTLRMGTW